jgi:hypothetical protein
VTVPRRATSALAESDRNGPACRDADPSELLADRGWGKAAAFQPVEEDDPLGSEISRR